MNGAEDSAVEPSTPQSHRTSVSRRLRSDVWNDYTRVQKPDGGHVAICRHCNKQLVGSGRSGTTHLRKHLALCKSTDPIKIKKKRTVHQQFDELLCRRNLARMVILHEHPFDIVGGAAFNTFVRNLQPLFKTVSPDTIRADCMKVYEDESFRLHELMSRLRCRVSVIVDTWRSNQHAEYVCLTCSYIDGDWKLKRRILNFVHVNGEEISRVIAEKLDDWNVSKNLSCLVLDNCRNGDLVARELLSLLPPKVALFNGCLYYANSCSHVLNLIAQDGLEVASEIISRVHSSFQYVKSSKERLVRFKKAVLQVGAQPKPLNMDVSDSWISIYSMLVKAIGFRDAFNSLSEFDSDYKDPLSPDDWNLVVAVTECLQGFYTTIDSFAKAGVQTANLCFDGVCGIQWALQRWTRSTIPVAAAMASLMLQRFEEYWAVTGEIMKVASVLDPRCKMKTVQYFCLEFYGTFEGIMRAESFGEVLKTLYNEFAIQHDSLSDAMSSISNEWDLWPLQNKPTSELDMYLAEAIHPSTESFDVLAWWKLIADKYPVLSLMARDILAIPLAHVASDSKGRTLNQYLSSMDSATVEGLICAQNWLKDEIEGEHADGLSNDPNQFLQKEFLKEESASTES